MVFAAVYPAVCCIPARVAVFGKFLGLLQVFIIAKQLVGAAVGNCRPDVVVVKGVTLAAVLCEQSVFIASAVVINPVNCKNVVLF